MNQLTTILIKRTLDALYLLQAHRLLAWATSGVGVIFTLHRVHPSNDNKNFAPNRGLAVTPEFLEQVIYRIHKAGLDVITLDQVHDRLTGNKIQKGFVCFTVDDGYRDIFEYAFPILQKHGLPFSIFLNTAMIDGKALLWWDLLELIFEQNSEVTVVWCDRTMIYPARTTAEKETGFWKVYWRLRGMPEPDRISLIKHLCDKSSIQPQEVCQSLSLTWEMVDQMASSGLVSFEAHTVNHPILSMVTQDAVRREAADSREIITERLGRRPNHFAYPYGDRVSAGRREFEIIRELAFDTAVTTQKGVIFKAHRNHLHSLPRVSLNGDYQALRYVDLFLSGVPFAPLSWIQRLKVDKKQQTSGELS